VLPRQQQADSRLPQPGAVITRLYKGQTLQVEVLPHGFAFQGTVYTPLSAVAKAMTKSPRPPASRCRRRFKPVLAHEPFPAPAPQRRPGSDPSQGLKGRTARTTSTASETGAIPAPSRNGQHNSDAVP
jgi:hypothetical protein